jgi:uncharacterized protein (TIGR02246 family)
MADYHEKNSQALDDEILGVYQDICSAFAKLDYDTVLEHFADEGMVKISQGQVLRGKEELAENWRQRIGDTVKLRIRIENVEVRRIDDRYVWATADEYISVDGQERRAIVSNIFVLQDSGWKILLDHTSYIETDD